MLVYLPDYIRGSSGAFCVGIFSREAKGNPAPYLSKRECGIKIEENVLMGNPW